MKHISTPLRLFAGTDALGALGKELTRAGSRRAVILCGRSVSQDPALAAVQDAAGDRLAGLCVSVRAHSPRCAVEEAVSQIGELGADALIAVGGGSAMVTARAVAILLAEGKPLDELCTSRDVAGKMVSPRLEVPKLPIFALPTTPSTAVVKPGTAVFDEAAQKRLALFDPKTRPAAIFLDPDLLASAPKALVRAAALNTLCSAIEGLASGTDDQLALAGLIHAVRLCARSPDGEADRSDLTMAAILCGRGTDHTGMGLATVISHAVAKAHDVDGGVAKAVVLPHVLRFNRDFMANGRDALALAFDSHQDDIESAITRVLANYGIPERMRDLEVPSDSLFDIAAACMGDWFIRTNPRPVTDEKELQRLLEAAW